MYYSPSLKNAVWKRQIKAKSVVIIIIIIIVGKSDIEIKKPYLTAENSYVFFTLFITCQWTTEKINPSFTFHGYTVHQ